MRSSKGFMSGKSKAMRMHHKTRGIQPVSKYLQEFKEGDKVHIDIVTNHRSGMPRPKYRGVTGIVKKQQGKCYVVQIKDMTMKKELIIHPVHLVPVKQ